MRDHLEESQWGTYDSTLQFELAPREKSLKRVTHHRVELGNTYSTADSAKIFTSYIAESQHNAFLDDFAKCKLFSFLIDGFADAGNLEDELIVVQYSLKHSNSEEVKSIVLVRLKLIIN